MRLTDDLSVLLHELLALLEAAAADAAVEAGDVDHLRVDLDERLVGEDVEVAHAAAGTVLSGMKKITVFKRSFSGKHIRD